MNFLKKKEPYCLVLSGGGTKGVYHLGAWRALKELGIDVDAFIGNSIGAIIAGFLAQGSEEKLYEIGRTITVDSLINIPEALVEKGELKISLKHLSSVRSFSREAILGGGLDTTPLRTLLNESLNEKLIRKSGNDLAVVTFNTSTMKSKEVFIEEMDEGTLIDYLMASSAFLGFHHPVIGGDKFIDGGVHDNMPYRLARARGYRKIIVIDVSGLGVNKRPNFEGSETVYIKNSINMGGVLDFDRKFIDSYIDLGYLDTMKTFGHLKGCKYFFKRDHHREKALEKCLDKVGGDLYIRNLLPPEMRKNKRDLLYSLAECAAMVFKLDKIHSYTIEELKEIILDRRTRDKRLLSSEKGEERRRLLDWHALFTRNSDVTLTGTPYHNWMVGQLLFPGKGGKLIHRSLKAFYGELDGALIFLDLIDMGYLKVTV